MDILHGFACGIVFGTLLTFLLCMGWHQEQEKKKAS